MEARPVVTGTLVAMALAVLAWGYVTMMCSQTSFWPLYGAIG
jgi:hypothetical protein